MFMWKCDTCWSSFAPKITCPDFRSNLFSITLGHKKMLGKKYLSATHRIFAMNAGNFTISSLHQILAIWQGARSGNSIHKIAVTKNKDGHNFQNIAYTNNQHFFITYDVICEYRGGKQLCNCTFWGFTKAKFLLLPVLTHFGRSSIHYLCPG